MKKIIGIVPLFALMLPFAAGAVYLESDASGGASAGNSGAAGGAQVQVVLGEEDRGSATVTKSVDEETGLPVIHIMNTGEAAVSADADDSAEMESEVKSSVSSEEKVKVEVKGNGTVEIKSKHKGKFLGFLPVTFTVRTDVEKQENGSLTARVNLPWWGFLISGAAKVQSDIEALVHANVNAGAAVDVSNSVKSSLEMETEAQ